MTPTDKLLAEVEQIDRDAAADLVWRIEGYSQKPHVNAIRLGQCDNCNEVQAFARHRLAALRTAPSEVVPVSSVLLNELNAVISAMGCVEFRAREPDLDLTNSTCAAILRDVRKALRASASPAVGSDELASYEKFDGIGPHHETIETRARIGERYLECYESALNDPRLKGYTPADCPTELLLDILNSWEPTPAPERTEPAEGVGLRPRKMVNTILGRHFSQFIDDVPERIRVGNAACTDILAALSTLQAARIERDAVAEIINRRVCRFVDDYEKEREDMISEILALLGATGEADRG